MIQASNPESGFSVAVHRAPKGPYCILEVISYGNATFLPRVYAAILGLNLRIVSSDFALGSSGSSRLFCTVKAAVSGSFVDESITSSLRTAVHDVLANDSSQEIAARHTLMEVVSDPSLGVHCAIARALSEVGVSIDRVHISTKGHSIVDVFFLSFRGRPLCEKTVGSLKLIVETACNYSVQVVFSTQAFGSGTDRERDGSEHVALLPPCRSVKFAFSRRMRTRDEVVVRNLEAAAAKLNISGVAGTGIGPPLVEPHGHVQPFSAVSESRAWDSPTVTSSPVDAPDCMTAAATAAHALGVAPGRELHPDVAVRFETDPHTAADPTATPNPASPVSRPEFEVSVQSRDHASLVLDVTSLVADLDLVVRRFGVRVNPSTGNAWTEVRIDKEAGTGPLLQLHDKREWLRNMIRSVACYPAPTSPPSYSVLEYVAEAQPRFFESVVTAFVRLGVRIVWAHVGTIDQRTIGVFHVLDRRAKPLRNELELEVVNNAVICAIAGV